MQNDVLSGTAFNVLDYGARSYDAVIGRFTEPDPLAEKYSSFSTYGYCVNNPLRYVDIKGKEPGDIIILFTGADFGQGPTATTSDMYNVLSQNSNGKTIIQYSSLYFLSEDKGIESAYNEIVSNNQINPDGKIIIYGYSYGGVLAIYQKNLEKEMLL